MNRECRLSVITYITVRGRSESITVLDGSSQLIYIIGFLDRCPDDNINPTRMARLGVYINQPVL